MPSALWLRLGGRELAIVKEATCLLHCRCDPLDTGGLLAERDGFGGLRYLDVSLCTLCWTSTLFHAQNIIISLQNNIQMY